MDVDSGSEIDSNVENEPCSSGTLIRWKGVTRFLENQVAVRDWLLVDFSDGDQQRRKHFFIGQVTKCGKNKLTGKFVSYLETKIDNGAIFRWPEVEDRSQFCEDQIIGFVAPPVELRRGQLKFQVDSKEWPK
jgi:hypothetical protein